MLGLVQCTNLVGLSLTYDWIGLGLWSLFRYDDSLPV
jgi:hypothetical protein